MNPKIASALRWALGILGTYLATKGKITPEQQEGFVTYALQFIGSVMAFYSLFWGQRDKVKTSNLLNWALALPRGSNVQALSAAASSSVFSGWQDLLINQAISTVTALVTDKIRRPKFARFLVPLRDALNLAFPQQ